MPLEKLIQKEVAMIEKDDSLGKAARQMKESHVGALVVVEKLDSYLRPIGMLTDRDIALYIAHRSSTSGGDVVDSVMRTNPVVVDVKEGLYRAIELMKQNSIRRLPVVNSNGHLLGIVTVDDIMKLLASEITALAEITTEQIEKEKKEYKGIA